MSYQSGCGFGRGDIPILFETMVFCENDPEWDQYQCRHHTYDEAYEHHQQVFDQIIQHISDLRNGVVIPPGTGEVVDLEPKVFVPAPS